MLSARELEDNIRTTFAVLPSKDDFARASEALRSVGYTADEFAEGLAFASKALNARHSRPDQS